MPSDHIHIYAAILYNGPNTAKCHMTDVGTECTRASISSPVSCCPDSTQMPAHNKFPPLRKFWMPSNPLVIRGCVPCYQDQREFLGKGVGIQHSSVYHQNLGLIDVPWISKTTYVGLAGPVLPNRVFLFYLYDGITDRFVRWLLEWW